MRFNLIVSLCRNSGIGYKGQLPWNIKDDLQNFAQLTKGDGNNAVVMGNATWQSLPIVTGKPRGLYGRDNLVLARVDSFDMVINHNRLMKTYKSIDELEDYLSCNENYEDIWIIGGANVYKQFLEMNKIQKCYVTYIDADFECDTFFPIDDFKKNGEWKEIERSETYDKNYKCIVSYVVYERCV